MRKLTIALLLVSLFVFSIAPSFAQDEPSQTIAEIVVASTEADPAEFTILLAAVGAANPAILEALSNPELSLTVFAPTDAAFAAAFEALGVTAEEVLADQVLLDTLLLYHVLPAAFDSSVVASADGVLYGTALPYSAIQVNVSDAGVVINGGANVTAVDIAASNGVIHVIDAVLVPTDLDAYIAEMEEMMGMEEMEAMGTIAEVAAAAPELTTLMQAVTLADPAVAGLLGSPDAIVTVFAPVNEAFATLPSDVQAQALSDTAVLTGILAYHVVPGYFDAETVVAVAEIYEGSFSIMTAAGLPITVSVTDEGVMLNDTIMVTATDIEADNGIVHLINGILLPPAAE